MLFRRLHAKDPYYTICRIEKSWNQTSFLHAFCPIKTLGIVLLFYHDETMNMYASFALRAILRLIKPRDITIWISIIGYSVPWHFLWFKNHEQHWFSNSFRALLFLVPKQLGFLLTRINCSTWGWWREQRTHLILLLAAKIFTPSL